MDSREGEARPLAVLAADALAIVGVVTDQKRMDALQHTEHLVCMEKGNGQLIT